MGRGPGLRLGLIAALLLGRLGLPAAHVAAISSDEHPLMAAAGGVTLGAPAQDSHRAGAHDASLCPICLASSQARTGIEHATATCVLRDAGVVAATPCEPALALPRTPELDSAAPRAPPFRALAFA